MKELVQVLVQKLLSFPLLFLLLMKQPQKSLNQLSWQRQKYHPLR